MYSMCGAPLELFLNGVLTCTLLPVSPKVDGGYVFTPVYLLSGYFRQLLTDLDKTW